MESGSFAELPDSSIFQSCFPPRNVFLKTRRFTLPTYRRKDYPMKERLPQKKIDVI
jgi:hypothetical protein